MWPNTLPYYLDPEPRIAGINRQKYIKNIFDNYYEMANDNMISEEAKADLEERFNDLLNRLDLTFQYHTYKSERE